MNERQQRAYVDIMAQLAMLPWQERSDVFQAVKFNDDICVHCGMATEKFGCQCMNDD